MALELNANWQKSIVMAGMALLTGVSAWGQVPTTNFFNWETPPVHPVALSPNSNILAVCNLPDGRLELFDVTSGVPLPWTNVPVGLDPVTVRFRTASEIWVANYISDSISIISLASARVVNTIATTNEPSDIVFAGTPQRAFVSCGQPNLVQVYDPVSLQLVTNLVIDGNRPRAMATSPDGSKVYVAIFESGNASTIISTGVSSGEPRPSPINFPFAPSGGLDPPPNSGTNFVPPINPLLGTNTPPRVSLIVKRNSAGRWMDDNQGDWTEFIRGTNATFTGRIPGWDMPDHDLVIIDAATFATSYVSGLMNICMAVAVNPVSGQVCVVGTDALNQVRFQPVLNGIFLRVNLAQVDPVNFTATITDLNSHLTYQVPQVSETERDKSIGDPRGMVWSSDGTRAYITGMGSDNLIIVDAQGNRAGLNPAISLDQGSSGLALDEGRQRLYIYNRFAGSISTVDTAGQTVIDTRPLWDPTPQVIKAGRPHLYNTHDTSGLGQASCASCHVDSRFDRLAWDLGDPTDVMKVITNANFANFVPGVTNNFHPMKGPMTTLTLQDIITHEPFHWRGDRDGIEQFEVTFTNLQGAVNALATNEMQDLKGFLGTVRFAPNPFRRFDNSLSTNLALPGQFALGRGQLAVGAPLPNGNAQNGQTIFRQTVAPTDCIVCHTLPTGLGTDMHFNGIQWQPVPLGSNAAHHVASIELERTAGLPFKIPSLRNLYDKFGMDLAHTNSRAGFGFFHDGGVDTLVRFIQDAFVITNDQTTADLTAFLFSFTGSDLIPGSVTDGNRSPGVSSLDTPASVGRQLTINSSNRVALLDSMIALANSSTSRVDLVAKGFKGGLARGWFFDRTTGNFQSDRFLETYSPDSLRGLAALGSEQTYTVVPRGTGKRIGIDEDGDGYLDRDELDFGSDPRDPLSMPTNVPPVLGAVSNLTVLKGRLLALTFTATDLAIPTPPLTFSLSNAPPAASVNSTNGSFAWLVPQLPPGTTTNTITVVVTDNNNRSDAKTFTVVAVDLTARIPTFGPAGTTLTLSGLPGLTYRLQFKVSLTDPTWLNVAGDVLATNTIALKLDPTPNTNLTRFYRVVALP
jgi:DNA-binding beta-propeller fold protein YncE